MSFEEKAVLVTGASRGLGRALASELAARGARVGLVARSAARLDEAVASIRAQGGVAHAIPGDLADKRAIHPIAGTAAALLGPIDVLILNAAELGPTPLKLLLDTDCEDLERVLAVNVVGPFRLAKALVGSMVLRGSGLVVAISSDAAHQAYPRWGAYSASKAAFDHLLRIFAAELEGTGVRFVSIDPGEMDTDMHAAAVPDADRKKLASPADAARRVLAEVMS